VEPLPPRRRGQQGRLRAARSPGRRARRRDRLPLRASLRPRSAGARPVAGAAGGLLRPRGAPLPAAPSRRDGGRARRGTRDPVLARRPGHGALGRCRPARDDRPAPRAAPGRPPGPTRRLLGDGRALARRGRHLRPRARHRPGPADVPDPGRGASPARDLRRRDQGRRDRLRRRLPAHARPQRASAQGECGGLPAAALDVGDRRGERGAIRAIPGLAGLETLRLPRGRGVAFRFLVPLAQAVPPLRNGLLSILRARFGAQRRS
jgi:hypothetical protein